MEVYAGMDPGLEIRRVINHAVRVEALGYDGLHLAETTHDPLALALLVAEHTRRITIRTSVALAFVRSPTLTAYAAWDLAKYSGGRFELGLGTQVRQNIEGRFGMPWGDPLARMRDYLGALGALFECFRTGGPLEHAGPYYHLGRMQPYFNPGPDAGTVPPPVWLGGVNAGICRLAGELAAGFVTHPTNSNPRYLEDLCLPNLAAGAARAGRAPADITLVVGTQVITGATAAELDAERERQRRLLAFLYSTPAYRPTLERYGWEDLTGRLQALVRANDWASLPGVVGDEVLETLVPTGTFAELPALLSSRFGSLAQGILLSPPPHTDHDPEFATVVAALRAL